MLPVLVPLKPLAQAKSRLAPVLRSVERARLAQAMAGDLVELLTGQAGIATVVVCGSDDSAEAIARRAGVRFLPEARLGASGCLNAVVDAAAALLAREGCNDLLVVHGDVPLLTSSELGRFLRAHAERDEAAVTVAPDRWRGGTNLLAWRGLASFRAQYGVGSFQRHCAAARDSGARLSVCALPGAAVDVDEPADLHMVRAGARGALAPRTQGVLREIFDAGLGERARERWGRWREPSLRIGA